MPQTLRDELRGIVERAHELGIPVIGQAVEDPQTAATLWTGGVDFLQGNLVQEPGQGLDYDFGGSVL